MIFARGGVAEDFCGAHVHDRTLLGIRRFASAMLGISFGEIPCSSKFPRLAEHPKSQTSC